MPIFEDDQSRIVHSFAISSLTIFISEICNRAFLTSSSLASRQSKFAVFLGSIFVQLMLLVATVGLALYLLTQTTSFIMMCLSTVIMLLLSVRAFYSAYGLPHYATTVKYDITHAFLDDRKKELDYSGNYVLRDQSRGKIGRYVFRVLSAAISTTFWAECSQRVKFVVLALSLKENLLGLLLGGTVAYVVSTGLAVVADRKSIHKIPLKHISVIGGAVYLLIALSGSYTIVSSYGFV